MLSWLVASPILVPFATAIIAFFLRGGGRKSAWASLVGCGALLVASIVLLVEVWQRGVVVAQMGGWPAPFGITLAADLLSAVMVLLTAITGLAVAIYALVDVDEAQVRFGFHALFQVLLAGVSGAFLTGDLFNLYVWFEVMLISSFGLLVLGQGKAQLDGGIKYVALNLVSTVVLLTAIGLLYGLTGTLNLADLHLAVMKLDNDGLLTVIAVLFIIAFGIKAAVFPLFFWLPASYHTPPVAVSAVFAGLLTKVGVYALFRMFTLVFTQDVAFTHGLLLAIAMLTMITGVLGAAAQNEFRKILSFHIVSQIGYMVLGLALFTPLALLGAVFYVVHHIIVKANLFLISGLAQRMTGTFELAESGGLYKSQPMLAALFLVPAFSLAGFPPLSGFWAKFLLIKASLDVGAYIAAAVALVVGLLTVFSMTKIWAEVFWKPYPKGDLPAMAIRPGERVALWAPVVLLASLTIVIGLMPEPFIVFAERAANQLVNPDAYIKGVLGGNL